MKVKGLNLKGLSKQVKGFAKSAKEITSSSASSLDGGLEKSKKKYKTQVKKIKDLFPKRKNKHSHKSKKSKPGSEQQEEDADEDKGGYEPEEDQSEGDSDEEPLIKKKSKSKKPRQDKKKKLRKASDSRQQLVDDDEGEAKPAKPANRSKESKEKPKARGIPNQIGLKYQAICTLLTILILASVKGLMLVTIIQLLGNRYGWNDHAPGVTTILILLGLASCFGIISSTYTIMFKLTALKSRSIQDWYLVMIFGVSGSLCFIVFIIALLQYTDGIIVFGERFLHLLKSYRTKHHEKMTMDRIQIEFHCCGILSYEDWFEIENLASYYGDRYVPFSCCSTHSLRPCVHENLPSIDEVVPEGGNKGILKDHLSIYYLGCDYPMKSYYKTMLWWVIFDTVILTCAQLLLLLLIVLIRKASSGSSTSPSARSKSRK